MQKQSKILELENLVQILLLSRLLKYPESLFLLPIANNSNLSKIHTHTHHCSEDDKENENFIINLS